MVDTDSIVLEHMIPGLMDRMQQMAMELGALKQRNKDLQTENDGLRLKNDLLLDKHNKLVAKWAKLKEETRPILDKIYLIPHAFE